MSDLNLVELAEQLTFEDVVELLARRLCMGVQEVAKEMIEDNADDAEVCKEYTRALSVSSAMIEEAQNMAYEGWFHHYDLSDKVSEALERVAEEYIR